jgi:hypothetical protein
MENWNSDIGWVGFYNKAHSEFSESFKVQFSIQLEKAFNAMTETENFAQKRGFQILVGMEDIKLIYQDGYGFGLLELITPNSESIPQTFFWQTENVEDAFKRNEFSNENIKFGFCTDFEKDYFLKFKKRNKVRVIGGDKLKFDYIEEIDLYPDLNISIEYASKLNQVQLEILKNEIQLHLEESYIGDVNQIENTVEIMIDFQGTEFKTGKKQLRKFIQDLNQRMDQNEIKTARVE